jgi:hypothetical protein
MHYSIRSVLVLVFAACGLCSCGTVVPDIKEVWDTDIPEVRNADGKMTRPPVPGAGQIEFEIKKSIYCELRTAVRDVNNAPPVTELGKPPRLPLPVDWKALVSLSLEVDESASLNPGLALNVPLANAMSTFGVINKTPVTTTTPQSFSVGFGGTLSSTATRIDKFDPSYTIRELLSDPPSGYTSMCDDQDQDPFIANKINPAKSSLLISSDLGIRNWLFGAVFTNVYLPSAVGPPAPTKKDLDQERRVLFGNGFSKKDVSSIIASGAVSKDVSSLERLGYTHEDIATYLDSGATPVLLQELKKEGYQPGEIKKIVTRSKPQGVGGSQQGSSGGSGQVPDTISIEIKFIIVSSGNVTPTWKLLRVSGNTGSTPLFALGRTRSHDVIITIGPPDQATASTHLASQIGNAVGSANRTELATPSSNTFNPFPF